MGSWMSIYNNAVYGVRMQTDRIGRLQEQASTGSRIIRSSDGPGDSHRILTLKDSVRHYENFQSNLTEVELTLNTADNATSTISELLTKANAEAVQGANGTLLADGRAAIGEDINELLEEVLAQANRQVMGRYIFAGTDSASPPYEATRVNGRITKVEYTGSQLDQPVPVAPGVTYSGQLIGEKFFQCDDRQAPVLKGDTGAAAGSGTSSARGDFWLHLDHTATNLGASGLTNGTDEDTILGDHTVEIDTAAQTIALDGGLPVSYTGTETNLEIKNADGDVIYVNTTGVLANGTTTITGQGQARIGTGAWVNLDYTDENFAVTDPVTGGRLYVDCTAIQREGREQVQIAGTYDVFSSLIRLRDLLLNEEDLSTLDQITAIQDTTVAMTEISQRFRQQMTIIGGRLGALSNLRQTLEDMEFNASTEAESIQQADIADVSIKLARSQTLYEMSLRVTANVINMSLLDYI